MRTLVINRDRAKIGAGRDLLTIDLLSVHYRICGCGDIVGGVITHFGIHFGDKVRMCHFIHVGPITAD
ncbi:MAG: hypothetical protein J1E62_12140 [Lachnospiraceae bacterium]|nr:hypothetical protein [Lachnospiraceae bacterium]